MSLQPDNEPDAVPAQAAERVIDVVVRGRLRDLGGFSVRRVLPSRHRRLVGPVIFWDEMGPAAFAPGQGLDVRPHPHIGLATVTYLFEGEIIHRDSLGSHQSIRPGAVNWMTAGRGIVHSERMSRTPSLAASERGETRLHGIQSWIALPGGSEEVPPSFHHHAAEVLPEIALPGARVRLLVGAAYGATSPVHVFSPMFYAEARLDAGAWLALPSGYAERAAYVVDGTVSCGGERIDCGAMAIASSRPADPNDASDGAGPPVLLHALTPSRVMLLGGAPLAGTRHIWWNFVSSSEARIEQAKLDWKEGRFPKVPGDEVEYIPLPE